MATAHPSKLRSILAGHVRSQRKELGQSPEELADRAEVQRTFIGHVERAETSVSLDNIARIARISDALEVPAWELLRSE